ncbi:hypothetical protein BC940DRAFT_229462, partial [Gongronella butleri]
IPFSQRGIHTGQMTTIARTKAIAAMTTLANIGAHQHGFGLNLALNIYRTFVRPMLEYGLAIVKPSPAERNALESAQTRCLRLALNVRNPTATTPTVMVQHLAALPSINFRRLSLTLRHLIRAETCSPATLLACVSLRVRQENKNMQVWRLLTNPRRNDTLLPAFHAARKVAPLNTSRNPVTAFLRDRHQEEWDKRRVKSTLARRARNKPIWDPILYAPASTNSRRRLFFWRAGWLLSYPLSACACGAPKADRHHLTLCPEVGPAIARLREIVPIDFPPHDHPIDTVLNALPLRR